MICHKEKIKQIPSSGDLFFVVQNIVSFRSEDRKEERMGKVKTLYMCSMHEIFLIGLG